MLNHHIYFFPGHKVQHFKCNINDVLNFDSYIEIKFVQCVTMYKRRIPLSIRKFNYSVGLMSTGNRARTTYSQELQYRVAALMKSM